MQLKKGFPNGERILAAEEVRAVEQRFPSVSQQPIRVLMQRAGEAAFALIQRCWPEARRLTVLCGKGNNGGDGFVVAMLAAKAGFEAKILMPELDDSSGDGADDRTSCPIKPERFSAEALNGSELIVDALMGIGLSGALREPTRGVVEQVNAFTERNRVPVLALDMPTGLPSDGGAIEGPVLRASRTITFIACKPGLLTEAGLDYVGEFECADLDIPEECFSGTRRAAEWLAHRHWQPQLLPRPRRSHKGDNGHVLLIGGAPGMGGAIRMSGEAALRSGAGLVSLYCHQSAADACLAARPELMAHGFEQTPEPAALNGLIERASVLAAGPGLSQADWVPALLNRLIETGKPLVLDADALNVLAKSPQPVPNAVLTPHPGEAARLLDCAAADVQADRKAAANAILDKYQAAAVVLKGAPSLIAEAERYTVLAEGNPAMATGGMGDVLTGIIAALMAQGLSPFDAARLGASLHAWAGDCAAGDIGQRGMLASDLFRYLPQGLSA